MSIKWPKWTFPVLLGIMVIQLAVPVSTLWTFHQVKKQGDIHYFMCAPVDPADPFRGKYLTLHFAVEDSSYQAEKFWETGQEVFAQIETDASRITSIAKLSSLPPSEEYCKVTITGITSTASGPLVQIALPISRYYVEESKAQELELRYREQLRNHQPLLAEVHLHKGRMVLTNLHFE